MDKLFHIKWINLNLKPMYVMIWQKKYFLLEQIKMIKVLTLRIQNNKYYLYTL